jgi:hypothetical protein
MEALLAATTGNLLSGGGGSSSGSGGTAASAGASKVLDNALFAHAESVSNRFFGRDVYYRGIVEFSNVRAEQGRAGGWICRGGHNVGACVDWRLGWGWSRSSQPDCSQATGVKMGNSSPLALPACLLACLPLTPTPWPLACRCARMTAGTAASASTSGGRTATPCRARRLWRQLSGPSTTAWAPSCCR